MINLAAALATPEFWCAHFRWRLDPRQLKRVFGLDPDKIEGLRFVSTLGPRWHARLFNHERRQGETYLRAIERADGNREAAWLAYVGEPNALEEPGYREEMRKRFDDAERIANTPNAAS